MRPLIVALVFTIGLAILAAEPCYVVTDFECLVPPMYGTRELQELVTGYLSRIHAVARTDRIFITDLNGDNSPEYFVPMGCGATGNCTYYIFADHPARCIGEVQGKMIIFTPGKDWPPIRTLSVSGMMIAYVTTYTYAGDTYQPSKEKPIELQNSIDPSQPQQIEEFMKELGGVKCECPKES